MSETMDLKYNDLLSSANLFYDADCFTVVAKNIKGDKDYRPSANKDLVGQLNDGIWDEDKKEIYVTPPAQPSEGEEGEEGES